MGKRSNFERKPRDFYPTPPEAVEPLLPFLSPRTRFVEPCAGNGALVRELQKHGHRCEHALDIEPQHTSVSLGNALAFRTDLTVITNPPWDRKVLHPLISHFAPQAPTWFLFDADWMHTKQSIPFMPLLSKVVSVGRVKWIPDSKMTGKDNCCWYLFDIDHQYSELPTEFFGRT